MLLITVIVLILLSLLSFVIFDRDILAPPTVVSLGLLFGALCAFYNEKEWGLNFSSSTTGFIAIGVGAFIVGGCLGVLLDNLLKMDRFGFPRVIEDVKPIDVSAIKTVVVILFQIVLLVLLFSHIQQLTGYSNWMSAVAEYRTLTGRHADPNDPAVRLPVLIRNMVEFGFAIGCVYAYIVGNNFAAHYRQRLLNWIPIILCMVTTFMQGDRSNMIRLWLIVLIVAYTLRKRSAGYKSNKDTRRMVRTMGLSLVGIGALFVALREVVGRETDMGPLHYLTFYAGCPTAALDQFLKHPIPASDIWGKETFYYTNQSLNVLIGRPERYQFYKEFIQSPNGTWIGNVYTALRPPFYDFGFFGMILVMIIMGAFFTYFYCKVRVKFGKSPVDFRLLLYGYVAYTFFMYFYNCYNSFLSHTIIKFCVELLIVRWALIGWKFKKRIRIRF